MELKSDSKALADIVRSIYHFAGPAGDSCTGLLDTATRAVEGDTTISSSAENMAIVSTLMGQLFSIDASLEMLTESMELLFDEFPEFAKAVKNPTTEDGSVQKAEVVPQEVEG